MKTVPHPTLVKGRISPDQSVDGEGKSLISTSLYRRGFFMSRIIEIRPKFWFRGFGKKSQAEIRSGMFSVADIKEEDVPGHCSRLMESGVQLVKGKYGRRVNGFHRFTTPPSGWGMTSPEPICIQICFGKPDEAEAVFAEIHELDRTNTFLRTPSLILKRDNTGIINGEMKWHYYKREPDEPLPPRKVELSDIVGWQ